MAVPLLASEVKNVLRPLWLLAVPLLAWLLWRLWHRERQSGRWQLLLPAAFHQVLLKGGSGRSSKLPWLALGLAWLLALLALLFYIADNQQLPPWSWEGAWRWLTIALYLMQNEGGPGESGRVRRMQLVVPDYWRGHGAAPMPGDLEWALLIVAVASFGLVAFAQALFPLWAHHPATAGLRVHLANGLYLNALLDRAIGGFRTTTTR